MLLIVVGGGCAWASTCERLQLSDPDWSRNAELLWLFLYARPMLSQPSVCDRASIERRRARDRTCFECSRDTLLLHSPTNMARAIRDCAAQNT